MSENTIFKEFDALSLNDWLAKVEKDLKGKKSLEDLNWNFEGLKISPFIRNHNTYSPSFSKKDNSWLTNVIINEVDISKANQAALEVLKFGVDSLSFKVEINSDNDLKNLLNGIQTEIIHLNFYTKNLEQLTNIISDSNLNLNCAILFSPTSSEDLSDAVKKSNKSNSKLFLINGSNYGCLGSTLVQELAFALSELIEYIEATKLSSINLDEVIQKITFQFSTGTSFFLEIAKYRAFRQLFNSICNEYGITKNETHLLSTTNSYHFSASDEHNNLLRATTSTMAAIIGGCNEINVLGFNNNSISNNDKNEAVRLAVNIQHILKYESFLDKVKDASSGAYYIENLTKIMMEEAWKLVLEIEEKGGYFKALESGFIQQLIQQNHSQNVKDVADGKKVIVGINKYQNKNQTSAQPKDIPMASKEYELHHNAKEVNS